MKVYKAIIPTLLLTFLSSSSFANESCKSAPYGIINDSNIHICHDGYYTDYNANFHIPVFVSYTLTKDMIISCNKRNGKFQHDPMANNLDASPEEFVKSGYDKGHMANAEDFLYNEKEETESFYDTNVLPQNPTNNRGGWKWLETFFRNSVETFGSVQLYNGGIATENDQRMKNTNVKVPTYLYKIGYYPNKNIALAFLVPNTPINKDDILKYQVSISQIEKITGIVIPLPENYNKNRIDKVDFHSIKSLTIEKENKCDSK